MHQRPISENFPQSLSESVLIARNVRDFIYSSAAEFGRVTVFIAANTPYNDKSYARKKAGFFNNWRLLLLPVSVMFFAEVIWSFVRPDFQLRDLNK
jgi:hypothetical protein